MGATLLHVPESALLWAISFPTRVVTKETFLQSPATGWKSVTQSAGGVRGLGLKISFAAKSLTHIGLEVGW